jgi:pSer/pThr/pTyr-binding forkhead associated (FHA) protein
VWNKDSNLLFDYETTDYTISESLVSSNGSIIKNDKKIFFNNKNKTFSENCLYNIAIKGDEYTLKFDEKAPIEERGWLVVRNTHFKNKQGYKLKEGDVIKFGKVSFRVNELRTVKKPQDNNNKAEVKENNGDVLQIIRRKKSLKCRICLNDDNESDNMIIRLPCKCKGSLKSIHVRCIQQWLKSKLTTKSYTYMTIYTFKNLECEICKTHLPERIKYKSEIINLIELPKPDQNFIVLENILEKRENRNMYIITLKDKNMIKVGRSNDSDVRMTDISISRNHASISIINNEYYIDDSGSKFGTLVQLNDDISLLPLKTLSLQVGKVYNVFTLKKTIFAYIRCYNNRKYLNADYNDYIKSCSILLDEENINVVWIVNLD